MKSIDDIAIIIQARLGSKRIPQKMIKPFAGTTLTDIFLEKIKQCKSFPVEKAESDIVFVQGVSKFSL